MSLSGISKSGIKKIVLDALKEDRGEINIFEPLRENIYGYPYTYSIELKKYLEKLSNSDFKKILMDYVNEKNPSLDIPSFKYDNSFSNNEICKSGGKKYKK